jgi:hypothetical protein
VTLSRCRRENFSFKKTAGSFKREERIKVTRKKKNKYCRNANKTQENGERNEGNKEKKKGIGQFIYKRT